MEDLFSILWQHTKANWDKGPMKKSMYVTIIVKNVKVKVDLFYESQFIHDAKRISNDENSQR
jgi:hypothetical protein